jgi:hypothetical protein
MERGDGSTSKSQRSLEMNPSPYSRFLDNLENSHSQGEAQDQKPRSTKHLELFNAFWIQLARRLLEAASLPKMTGRHSKDQLEGQESYTKFFADTSLQK